MEEKRDIHNARLNRHVEDNVGRGIFAGTDDVLERNVLRMLECL